MEIPRAAVLFDMDGVLVDSRAVVKRTWRRWCERTGMDETAVLSAAHGRRTMDTLREVAPQLHLETEAEWLEEAELSDRDGIVAVAGAQALTRGVPTSRWAVVTSAGRELAPRRLDWTGLPVPRSLVAAEDVSRGKPSPEGYLRAAGDLGVDPPSCIVIEDSPAGIEAARAAGARILGLTTTHDPSELQVAELLLPDLVGIGVRRRGGDLVLGIDR